MLALISGISGFGLRFVQRCRTERAYRQLDAMDGRILRDLGLDRHQIALMPGGVATHRPRAN